jgi:hypothetical protein
LQRKSIFSMCSPIPFGLIHLAAQSGFHFPFLFIFPNPAQSAFDPFPARSPTVFLPQSSQPCRRQLVSLLPAEAHHATLSGSPCLDLSSPGTNIPLFPLPWVRIQSLKMPHH